MVQGTRLLLSHGATLTVEHCRKVMHSPLLLDACLSAVSDRTAWAQKLLAEIGPAIPQATKDSVFDGTVKVEAGEELLQAVVDCRFHKVQELLQGTTPVTITTDGMCTTILHTFVNNLKNCTGEVDPGQYASDFVRLLLQAYPTAVMMSGPRVQCDGKVSWQGSSHVSGSGSCRTPPEMLCTSDAPLDLRVSVATTFKECGFAAEMLAAICKEGQFDTTVALTVALAAQLEES